MSKKHLFYILYSVEIISCFKNFTKIMPNGHSTSLDGYSECRYTKRQLVTFAHLLRTDQIVNYHTLIVVGSMRPILKYKHI